LALEIPEGQARPPLKLIMQLPPDPHRRRTTRRFGIPMWTNPILNRHGPTWRNCAQSSKQPTAPLQLGSPSVKFYQPLKRQLIGHRFETVCRFA